MSITTSDGYWAAAKQIVTWNKTTTRATAAAIPFSMFDIAGMPGAGVLAVGNTTSGIVPTDAIAGYPPINTVTGTGYLTRVMFSNTVACRLALYDRVFAAGAFAFNANTTLTSQPSFIGRLPNSNYGGLELWIEAASNFTGSQSVRVQYLDQDGNAGDTGTIALGVAPTAGRMTRLPLASGDSGVSQITTVTSTVATVGTFNVYIMRKLWEGRVNVFNSGDTHPPFRTGMPIVYDTSAIVPIVWPDGTSSGLPCVDFEIAQG